jgi:hypothetical protein
LLPELSSKGTDMEHKHLTDELIASVASKRNKRRLVYDSEVRSLAVSVSPKGKKTFVVVKRLNGAKHASRRLIAVDGYQRHLFCTGPTLILEEGGGGASPNWVWISGVGSRLWQVAIGKQEVLARGCGEQLCAGFSIAALR